MANETRKVSNLATKSVIANTDLFIVGNTTNTFIMSASNVRTNLFAANSNASVPFPSYPTANTPPANAHANGYVIYVSDGANGNPCFATSNGTNWLIVATLGGVISST